MGGEETVEREWLREALEIFIDGKEEAKAPEFEHLAAVVVYATELEEALVREGILPEDTVGLCTAAFATVAALTEFPWDEFARTQDGKLLVFPRPRHPRGQDEGSREVGA